jgi:hypothetical protein
LKQKDIKLTEKFKAEPESNSNAMIYISDFDFEETNRWRKVQVLDEQR